MIRRRLRMSRNLRQCFGLRHTLLALCFFQIVFLRVMFKPFNSSVSTKRTYHQNTDRPILTAVILTYSKVNALEKLLRSVVDQRLTKFRMEILVVDNGCKAEIRQVFDYFLHESTNPYLRSGHKLQYIPLCDNPGYAIGNNKGVAIGGSPRAKYLLFFNDDIILSDENFIQNMLLLIESKRNAAAVGCKIVNSAGNKLQEAGSIMFKDGSATGFGRGMKFDDIFRSELSFPRPVDYVSGACLLIEREVFVGYKHEPYEPGFDSVNFPNYYEDTDLQLHIQHDLNREVWIQPKSIARHEEHGSFGVEASARMMQNSQSKFYAKWKDALENYHVSHPILESSEEDDIRKGLLLASDVRARRTSTANILYIDELAPDPFKGSGFGRALDNLSMITELGHKITVLTRVIEDNNQIIEGITDLGIEYYKNDIKDLVSERFGLYDVVVVSRPDTFLFFRDELKIMYFKSPFVLIYDSEALAFRRDELRLQIKMANGIEFPEENVLDLDDARLLLEHQKSREVSLLDYADMIVTVSDRETSAVSEIAHQSQENVYTIGHIMDLSFEKENDFENRLGILFVASFAGAMYYNGDAIWYFLTEVYPLVSKGAKTPIPLTIAGRNIPHQLREAVEKDPAIYSKVSFLESPKSLQRLMDESRIFIAPHLYGAGIQYKVSEALSKGVPVVMSRLTYECFGNVPSCVGDDPQSMKDCVIDIHGNRTKWMKLHEESKTFIAKTHSRNQTMIKWSKVISRSLSLAKKRRIAFEAAERSYRNHNENTDNLLGYSSGLEHFYHKGKGEGKIYNQSKRIWNGLASYEPPQEKECYLGERNYFRMYPDVEENWPGLAFDHYLANGKEEGRIYSCDQQCSEGERIYKKMYPDLEGNWNGSAFDHYMEFGRQENRVYLCRK